MEQTHPVLAVILTALAVEYQAVRTHLTDLREEIHPHKTIYERGIFAVGTHQWPIAVARTDKGNANAAFEAERALAYFQPRYAFFVGIAGGLKDVCLGDVVVADKVYGYEAGKADTDFRPRPTLGLSTYSLVQRANKEAMSDDWHGQLLHAEQQPRVFVGPIAAGEKVLSATRSQVWQFLQAHYGDALAVEMEGYGFLQSAHAHQGIEALVVRGISDLIDGKSEADKAHSQERASLHASAFAFEVLAKVCASDKEAASRKNPSSATSSKPPKPPVQPIRQSGKYNTHIGGKVQHFVQGDHPQVHIQEGNKQHDRE